MKISTVARRGNRNSENISGNPLRRLRLEHGYTLQQVADGVNLATYQAAAKFEKQNIMPRPPRLDQFARFYGLEPAELVAMFYEKSTP